MDFNSVDVKERLLQFLKAGFQQAGVRMNVLKSDPQTAAELPCIGINRIADGEAVHSLGDYAGSDFDKDSLEYSEVYSAYYQESMEVRIWHTNADERERVYRLLKALLMVFRPVIVEQGVRSFTVEGGKDESDFTGQVAPFPVYWASVVISYLNPLDVQVGEMAEIITNIIVNGGIVIDTEEP
ncbi:hypothetical protein [Paenibacillus graminis]|uniref:hypothetical protein n=1 Tax=Paenibacillus graminis TaxID=189425 RepID=UPI002DBDD664|nr:hypothetical protein [Paenibacillus graminis]MEC0169912.1 hypothetical protein [Paenibacillus graminis]